MKFPRFNRCYFRLFPPVLSRGEGLISFLPELCCSNTNWIRTENFVSGFILRNFKIVEASEFWILRFLTVKRIKRYTSDIEIKWDITLNIIYRVLGLDYTCSL